MISNRELADLLEQLIYYINTYNPDYDDDVVHIKSVIRGLKDGWRLEDEKK